MKRAARLRSNEQFQRVRREGRAFHAGPVTMTAATGRRRAPRCGFVVGRKVGTAVVRNRARRRLREAVRLVYDMIAPRSDLVFVIRSATVAELPFTELQALVEGLLRRAGVFQPALQSLTQE